MAGVGRSLGGSFECEHKIDLRAYAAASAAAPRVKGDQPVTVYESLEAHLEGSLVQPGCCIRLSGQGQSVTGH